MHPPDPNPGGADINVINPPLIRNPFAPNRLPPIPVNEPINIEPVEPVLEGDDSKFVPGAANEDPLSESEGDDQQYPNDNDNEDISLAPDLRRLHEQEPSRTGRRHFRPARLDDGASGLSALTKKFKHTDLNKQFLAMLNWSKTVDLLASPDFASMWSQCTAQQDFENKTFEWLHPMILAAKANSEDNPTWQEAMNGPCRSSFESITE